MRSGAEFFKQFLQSDIKRIAVENPIMHMYAKYIIDAEQSQTVQPWMFGDKALKATCLWLKNLPQLQPTSDLRPPTDTVEKRKWAQVFMAPPSEDRGKIRSKTYVGLAQAMAEQWGCLDD